MMRDERRVHVEIKEEEGWDEVVNEDSLMDAARLLLLLLLLLATRR